ITFFSLRDEIINPGEAGGARSRDGRACRGSRRGFKLAREQTVARAGRLLLLVTRLVKEVCGLNFRPKVESNPPILATTLYLKTRPLARSRSARAGRASSVGGLRSPPHSTVKPVCCEALDFVRASAAETRRT